MASNDRPRLLVVDDEAPVRKLLVSLLVPQGFEVTTAASAEEAWDVLCQSPPDLVLLDFDLPGKNGDELLADVRARPETRLIPVVMITGHGTRDVKLRAIEAGVTDFLPKPFDAVELLARVRSLVRLKRATDALEDAENVIISLAKTIDARDPYTGGHSDRVALYASLLGERIGLRETELLAVQRAGLFHDIGKIAVRDHILLKPGRLEPAEMEEMRQHPVVGRDLLRGMKSLSWGLPIVYHHHERLDGSGYPDGLAGESIPLTARVTSLADIYDALTTARVYRKALTREAALGIMQEEARRGWWDRRLLDELRGALETLPVDDPRIACASLLRA